MRALLRFYGLVLALAAGFVLSGAGFVLAQSSAPADDVFGAGSTVTIPLDPILNFALPVAALAVLVLVAMLWRLGVGLLPPWLRPFATDQVRDLAIKLAGGALAWGIQAVKDAEHGKSLSLNIGSPVLAAAARKALAEWPAGLIAKLGGEEGIKRFLIEQAEAHNVIFAADTTAEQILASPAVKAVTGNP